MKKMVRHSLRVIRASLKGFCTFRNTLIGFKKNIISSVKGQVKGLF